MTYCNNCGYRSHCGNRYTVEDEDGFTGEAYEKKFVNIVVVKSAKLI